ncbi:hypothetical protein BGZ82_008527 [Podila clonocystis]|nr:hypothetical protein BGZ82_008527 [Podila clonocystis]
MDPNPSLSDAERLLIEAYTTILNEPFEDKYEDRWEDAPFDLAIDVFKSRAQEIGFSDPLELLARFKIESYESIRAQLKKGPPLCFRPGWQSPLVGQRIDPYEVTSHCGHLLGPRFEGKQRVVVLEFWASWCDPCVEAGPDLSELADHYRYRGDDVAVIGINNESIFGVTKPADLNLLSSFLEANQDGFRYTILVDNDEGYAKDTVYKATAYRGIPCVVLVIDGLVTYVGAPQEHFRLTLDEAIETIAPQNAKEP